jgi:hypothetical protein
MIAIKNLSGKIDERFLMQNRIHALSKKEREPKNRKNELDSG